MSISGQILWWHLKNIYTNFRLSDWKWFVVPFFHYICTIQAIRRLTGISLFFIKECWNSNLSWSTQLKIGIWKWPKRIMAITQSLGETPVTMKRWTYIFFCLLSRGNEESSDRGNSTFHSRQRRVSGRWFPMCSCVDVVVCCCRPTFLLLFSSSLVQPRWRTITVPASVNVCKKKQKKKKTESMANGDAHT